MNTPVLTPVLWQKALKEMVALELEAIIPDHGPVAMFKDLQEINEFFYQASLFIQLKIEEISATQKIANDPSCPECYSLGIHRQ